MKRFSFHAVKLFLTLISLLPFRMLYLLSDLLYVMLYYVLKYRRQVVADNLRNSFPEKSPEELVRIEKDYYAYLSDLMVESIKSITISESEIRKRFTLSGLELLTDKLNRGHSLIAISGHYGNWEWGALRIALAFEQKKLVVYKPLTDPLFDSFINRIRSRFGTEMISMKNTLRALTKYRKDPHLLILVGDQTPPREETQYFLSFLNQPTAVFLGAEKISERLSYPLVYFNIKRLKRGYYECSILPLIEDPADPEYPITHAHTRMLEEAIRREPAIWLWSHKRWKFKPEDIT